MKNSVLLIIDPISGALIVSVPFPPFFLHSFEVALFVQFEQRGLMLSGVVLLLSLIGLCRFCGWGEEGVMKIE